MDDEQLLTEFTYAVMLHLYRASPLRAEVLQRMAARFAPVAADGVQLPRTPETPSREKQ